jgi:hypothetical protein
VTAAPANRTVLSRHSGGTSGLPLCSATHGAPRTSPTPTVGPAVFSYGRLDDAG